MDEKQAKSQEKKVNSYIKKYLKKGYSASSLEKTLLDFGYSKDIIRKVFDKYSIKKESIFSKLKIPSFNLFKKKEEKIETKKIPGKSYFVIAGLAILILIAIILVMGLPKDCSYDKQCFIDNAHLGKYVILKEDIVGSTLQYTNNNNIVTKEFVVFSKDEPEEIVNLLKNKKMECLYESFDDTIIDGIFGASDKCQGDLLDTIYELKIVS